MEDFRGNFRGKFLFFHTANYHVWIGFRLLWVRSSKALHPINLKPLMNQLLWFTVLSVWLIMIDPSNSNQVINSHPCFTKQYFSENNIRKISEFRFVHSPRPAFQSPRLRISHCLLTRPVALWTPEKVFSVSLQGKEGFLPFSPHQVLYRQGLSVGKEGIHTFILHFA